MIRHILLCRLDPAATADGIARIRSELAALDCPGRTSFTMGRDLGLRPGNMDLAIVSDFESREAFAAYDVDPEHDRIRRDLIAPLAERLERCQFEL